MTPWIIKNYTDDFPALWLGCGEQVRDAAQYIVSNTTTIVIYLDHCYIPGSSSLRAWPMLSMGIHNEPGHRKMSLLPLWRTYLTLHLAPCSIQLTHTALDTMLDTTDSHRFDLPLEIAKDQVVLLVNNLGP
ncbi:hypothetical protein BC938DRAFT_480446 [Jimgerdemannia flammicorona]|uniref:DhaK domain-containing protein n=1 Tax=Jimgerdemannia flammicorona TaxID=994334 RepID=A0A433QII4_9FUNG|nr:hypothetical protein BC938DRAFT_480446 [Jimgerdemannia flammicorona]